jgi:hypothetical protein
VRKSCLKIVRPPKVIPSGYLDGLAPQLYDTAMLATEVDFVAELERVVRGERPTVDPRALLFMAAEVILEARNAEERDCDRVRRACPRTSNLIEFPKR